MRRELDHIKICVANLTATAKKEDASRRKELHRTGAGPSTSEEGLSEEALILPTIMPTVFQPLPVLDSDEVGEFYKTITPFINTRPFMACMVYL
jgi:hypothetical protein